MIKVNVRGKGYLEIIGKMEEKGYYKKVKV